MSDRTRPALWMKRRPRLPLSLHLSRHDVAQLPPVALRSCADRPRPGPGRSGPDRASTVPRRCEPRSTQPSVTGSALATPSSIVTSGGSVTGCLPSGKNRSRSCASRSAQPAAATASTSKAARSFSILEPALRVSRRRRARLRKWTMVSRMKSLRSREHTKSAAATGMHRRGDRAKIGPAPAADP